MRTSFLVAIVAYATYVLGAAVANDNYEVTWSTGEKTLVTRDHALDGNIFEKRNVYKKLCQREIGGKAPASSVRAPVTINGRPVQVSTPGGGYVLLRARSNDPMEHGGDATFELGASSHVGQGCLIAVEPEDARFHSDNPRRGDPSGSVPAERVLNDDMCFIDPIETAERTFINVIISLFGYYC